MSPSLLIVKWTKGKKCDAKGG